MSHFESCLRAYFTELQESNMEAPLGFLKKANEAAKLRQDGQKVKL